jgi:hypothetical protein
MCEREGGFIPRYCTDIPQDKVDYTIRDMQLYTHRLIAEDLGLGQQIEDTIKKMEIQRQMELDEKNASVEEGIVLSDDDHSDYFEAIEE